MRYLRLLIASIKELNLQLLYPFYRCADLLADVPALGLGRLRRCLITACPDSTLDMSTASEPRVRQGKHEQHRSSLTHARFKFTHGACSCISASQQTLFGPQSRGPLLARTALMHEPCA